MSEPAVTLDGLMNPVKKKVVLSFPRRRWRWVSLQCPNAAQGGFRVRTFPGLTFCRVHFRPVRDPTRIVTSADHPNAPPRKVPSGGDAGGFWNNRPLFCARQIARGARRWRASGASRQQRHRD